MPDVVMSEASAPVAVPPGAAASTMDPATLWATFSPSLRRFLARRVPPGVDPDDLVQEVFVRVVRNLGTLGSIERPDAWLYQIARNALHDALRVRLRREARTDALEFDVVDDVQADVDQTAAADLAPCLAGMIGRLPEPYRSAIALTSLQGVTQTAAARQAGVSTSGMKSRVQRGREQLRSMLERCCTVALDVRGGVADFQARTPGACGVASTVLAPAASTTREGRCCAAAAARASSA